jgi:hypothetical protein
LEFEDFLAKLALRVRRLKERRVCCIGDTGSDQTQEFDFSCHA